MRTRTAAATLLTTVLLVGCGGEDEEAARPAPTQPAATASPPAPEASAGPAEVAIVDFEYEPAELTVDSGTEVTWTNEDASNHTVTFEKGPGDLGNVDEGGELSAAFEKPGTYAYVCEYHPNMKGTITVR